LTARDVVRRVQSGGLTAEAVCRAHIERSLAVEADVQAWQCFAPQHALAQARQPDPGGALAGVVLGVKDMIDTADLPTCYGSHVYEGCRPPWDAPVVTLARQQGAVVLGKTACTEFALTSAAKTRNPSNKAHTPGGSSSGSCAAVAAGMVHAALGTQTSGSIIRPASFCGVVGYKPSFGVLNRTGVKALSDSLDTVGVIARNVRDVAMITAVLAERPALMPGRQADAPRFGLFVGSRRTLMQPEAENALRRAAAAAAIAAGALPASLDPPEWFDALYAYHDAVMGWETPRALAYERASRTSMINEATLRFLDSLSSVTLEEYDAAQQALIDRASLLDRLFGDCDVLLTQAATGEAPRGLDFTGDPVFNKVWTLLHAPCVTLTAGHGPLGLPVGVQLVGRLGDDAGVLAAAALLEDALAQLPRDS
jgi:amidase